MSETEVERVLRDFLRWGARQTGPDGFPYGSVAEWIRRYLQEVSR